MCSAVIDVLEAHIQNPRDVSEALALRIGANISIVFPFQSEGVSSDNYWRLRSLMNDTANPRLRAHIFDLLYAYVHRKESTYRGYLDDRDLLIAYRSAKGLVKLGHLDAAPEFVQYGWDLYNNRVGRPEALGSEDFKPPFDLLEDVIEGAPRLYTRDAQLRWVESKLSASTDGV